MYETDHNHDHFNEYNSAVTLAFGTQVSADLTSACCAPYAGVTRSLDACFAFERSTTVTDEVGERPHARSCLLHLPSPRLFLLSLLSVLSVLYLSLLHLARP